MVSRRVVFLDIDGVLNSVRYVKARGPRGELANDLEYWDLNIDPEAVASLNEIVKASGADVVISSSWRRMLGLADIRGCLKRRGFLGRVVDRTPEINCRIRNSVIERAAIRGDEVQAWLEDNRDVADFCILDDGNDMGELSDHLVLIDAENGLGPKHVAPALARLGVAP